MTVGTRSMLFGAHCFFLHPWFVARAWWNLYGFPWDPRLWVGFIVHDLGYFGKPNMDGEEGEQHPRFGARIMGWLFDDDWWLARFLGRWFGRWPQGQQDLNWTQFTLFHSRYLAKAYGVSPSRLCVADKLAIVLTPSWLYLPMARATGEIREYMAHSKHRLVGNERVSAEERARLLSGTERDWHAGMCAYLRRWVEAHRDGQEDSWTGAGARAARDVDGVWR